MELGGLLALYQSVSVTSNTKLYRCPKLEDFAAKVIPTRVIGNYSPLTSSSL
jgi:hypothetical protein